MEILVFETPEEVADYAAGLIAGQVSDNPDSVLGLATGSTPEKTYARLVKYHKKEGLSFSGITTFNLDEYLSLAPDHPQSYRYFMNQKLFQELDINLENTHVPDGMAQDPARECQKYEDRIRAAGGIDLWLLGIGKNGHIAFNEPGSSARSRTRVIDLAAETIDANSDGRFFSDSSDVPRQALTAGIATINEARKLILLATGDEKKEAIKSALSGTISESCPASQITNHQDCTFIIDQAAASLLD